MELGPLYVVLDRRTGRRAGIAAHTRARGELQVIAWRERQRRGGRPDLSFETCQALTLVPIDVAPPW